MHISYHSIYAARKDWGPAPVWPDDEIKSCPIYPDIAQKVGKMLFTWKLHYLK